MKKGHSASWLQEAFVRLHQILFQRKLLPLSGFGEYRAHTPRGRGAFDKTSISRRAFVLFIRRESERVRRNAICLGWDSQKHLPPRCDQWRSWSFVFQAGVPRVATGRVLHADLTKLESGAPAGVPSFDLIVCNEVLEHVPDPFAATRSLYALLKPGGHIHRTLRVPSTSWMGFLPLHGIWRSPNLFASRIQSPFAAAGRKHIPRQWLRSGIRVGRLSRAFDSFRDRERPALSQREQFYFQRPTRMALHQYCCCPAKAAHPLAQFFGGRF